MGYASRLNHFIFLFALLAGCTRVHKDTETSSLTVRLPSTQQLSVSKAVGKFHFQSVPFIGSNPGFHTTNVGTGEPFNPLLNPTNLSGFDCFAVMVGGGSFNQKGMCTTSDGQSFALGAAKGGVPAGQSLSLNDIPSGTRTIVLVGFNVQSATDCHDFFTQPLPENRLSYPHVLAKVEQNLQPGNVSLTLTAAYSTKKITDCHFSDADGGGGTGYYGNGLDGDITLTSLTELNVVNSPNFSGRALTSIRQVDAIADASTADEPNTALITLADSWSSAHIGVGDEVMLYVAGAAGTGCGNSILAGFSATGKVTESTPVGSLNFKMEMYDERFLSIAPTQLQAAGYGANPNFCRMVAIRVPHLNNLTITGGTVNIKVANTTSSFSYSSNDFTTAGLLMMRVANNLTVNSGATANFDVVGAGFKGGTTATARGHGTNGWTDGDNTLSRTPLGNGGGTDGASAGGGAHGGAGGGLSNSGGSVVGDAYGCANNLSDASMKCLLGKFFLGGGGGADGSIGGSGGGVIRLYVSQILNSGSLVLNANGAAGLGTNDGGGAGGSIYLQAGTVDSTSGSLSFTADGGAGNATGGVGGGGRIHIQVVDEVIAISSSASSVAIGGAGTTAGSSAGTCYAEGVSISGCP